MNALMVSYMSSSIYTTTLYTSISTKLGNTFTIILLGVHDRDSRLQLQQEEEELRQCR